MQLIAGICDDCKEQVELLDRYLKDYRGKDGFVSFSDTDPYCFLETIRERQPDIVFLDIDMKGLNGIELGEKIKTLYENTVIIFITAYEKYALEAFRVRAFHYLIKPLSKETFSRVLEEALSWIRISGKSKAERTFTIQNKGETAALHYNDICYFEKAGHKIRINTIMGCKEYYGNFIRLLEQIGTDCFIQCHQGYIVNVGKIRAFRDKTLFLDGGNQIPVSRTFVDKVREAMAKQLFAGKESL